MRIPLACVVLLAGCSFNVPGFDGQLVRDAGGSVDQVIVGTPDLTMPDFAAPPDLFQCAGDGDCSGANPRCDTSTGRCVPCLPTNDNCASGQRCVAQGGSYVCSSGCKVDGDCAVDGAAGTMKCCSGTCIDTSSSDANCSACGTPCSGSTHCCSSACVDESGDVNNCGGCGKACSLANATATCVAGGCTVQSCTTGFADCDGMAANGCEVNTTNDPMNCNGCKNACVVANAAAGCAASMCTVAMCAMGYADCNAMATDGCEINTQTDVNNCGGCNMGCTLANATAKCTAGACAIAQCNTGFADCNNDPTDGCEVNLKTDTNNCNACGTICPAVANGTPGCSSGMCGIGTCSSGYADCNSMASDGCEVHTDADPNNCGSCNNKCSLSNAVAGCSGGQCTVSSCATGFGNCDNVASNGCEVTLATDNNNCGACGNKCSASAACGTTVNTSFQGSAPTTWDFNNGSSWQQNNGFGYGLLTSVGTYDTRDTIVYKNPIVTDSFTAQFDFWMGGGSNIEGMGFFIATDGPTAVGVGYGSLAMGGLHGYGVEFDTFNNNDGCGDSDNNHVAVDDLQASCSTVKMISGDIAAGVTLASQSWHTAIVTFNQGAVTLTIDGVKSIDNYQIPGWSSGTAYYYGFSGTTAHQYSMTTAVTKVTLTFPTSRCL